MKLKTKLIIAFSSIVVAMALLQSIYFQNRIEHVFENYVKQNENGRIQYWNELLSNYYQYYGSWESVQEVLTDLNMDNRMGKGPRWSSNNNNNTWLPGMGMPGIDIMVADQNGIIVGSSKKDLLGLPQDKVPGIHEDLLNGKQKIGEMIVYQEKSMGLLTIEQEFIDSINHSILFGTTISVGIAVILGLLLSRIVTRPLEKLMIGIRQIAKGDTSYRVEVSTKDEFLQLANAFNEMSQKLEQIENVRKSLVADVAHELRTPLAILSGRLESIQEGAIEPSQEVIIQLSDEVFRLTRLVNDLQQLSLAEAGKLPLNLQQNNLNEMIGKVVHHFSWLAEEKNITLKLEANDNINLTIDHDRITQVIINLIGNALRHTEQNGRVTVRLEQYIELISIEIIDNGPGISPEYLPYIFERFYRIDNSRTRDQGGTGLGLSIAKGYIEAHGGKIMVQSAVGEGTTFKIVLPVKS